MAAKMLSIEALAKRYPLRGGKFVLFENLWLAAPRGEITCVIGPTGCGETMLVNILAGVETASDGVVILDGHEVEGPGLDRALLAVEPCLFPWRTVLGNIGYAVRAKWPGWSHARAVEQVRHVMEMTGLAGMETKFPDALSAGLQQRVALARALSVEPRLLLLDEPFIALDAITRAALHDDLRQLCLEKGLTVFLATHDIDEAIVLADRIVLMSAGPKAMLAELLENPLPRERKAADIHRHPHYYALRNHIADFLANRAAGFAAEIKRSKQQPPREVPVARPGAPEPAIAGRSGISPVSARSAEVATIQAATRSVEDARHMPSLRSLLRKARAEFGE